MKTYFDTSYLVALYVPNDHTAAALRHRGREHELPVLFNPLVLFVTFERDQFELAKAEGLRVLVPH